MARNALIQLRRGTAATWTSVNPVLANAEPGYETDTGKEKRGDGSTTWNSLPYFLPGSGTTGAPDWAATTVYKAGQLVAYGNTIWRAKADFTSGSTFSASNWDLLSPISSVAGKTGTVTLVKGDVGLGNVDNTSDANKPASTPQRAAFAPKGSVTQPVRAQSWLFTGISSNSVPTATPGTNGSLYLSPLFIPVSAGVNQMAIEVTTAGETGALLRMGIYDDDGFGVPNNLVVDAGSVPGDATGVQLATVSATLAPGLYWVGVSVQTAPTTRPTLRGISAAAIAITFPGTPTAGQVVVGHAKFGLSTGPLPATFNGIQSASGFAPRIGLRFT